MTWNASFATARTPSGPRPVSWSGAPPPRGAPVPTWRPLAEPSAGVEAARQEARAGLAAWTSQHGQALPIGALPEEALEEALEETGEPDAPGLDAVFGAAATGAVQDLRDEQAGLRAERDRA